jgi:hypothetical protein
MTTTTSPALIAEHYFRPLPHSHVETDEPREALEMLPPVP